MFDKLIAKYLALPSGFRVFVAVFALIALVALFASGC